MAIPAISFSPAAPRQVAIISRPPSRQPGGPFCSPFAVAASPALHGLLTWGARPRARDLQGRSLRSQGSCSSAPLVLQGRYAEARKLFDRLLLRCNDVGSLAEEFDPLTGRMLGNFPQAYSHVGLINCALSLSRHKGPAEERAESQEAPIAIASAVE
jgi:hypothetical protein